MTEAGKYRLPCRGANHTAAKQLTETKTEIRAVTRGSGVFCFRAGLNHGLQHRVQQTTRSGASP